ncbi:MAG: twin-arginine translocase subunit TatC [Planctomycetota bacterium]
MSVLTSRLSSRAEEFDPNEFRMSVGDHLEDLRRHLIFGLIGVFVAFFGCLIIAKSFLLPIIAGPLIRALREADVSPQLFFTGVADPFMVYLRVSMIGAFVISGPWLIFQAWRFVATGLYAKERRLATKFLPVALLLFAAGVTFVWFIILPLTLKFFIGFGTTINLPAGFDAAPKVPVSAEQVVTIPTLAGDPAEPVPLQLWFDETTQRLKMSVDGQTRVIAFGSNKLAAPMITLPDYVNLVLVLLVVFGISFQMPLLVAGLIRTGIVLPQTLREQRRIVYFVMVVAACAITPGDIIVATLGLIIPLIALFEAGIWLGERGSPASAKPS